MGAATPSPRLSSIVKAINQLLLHILKNAYLLRRVSQHLRDEINSIFGSIWNDFIEILWLVLWEGVAYIPSKLITFRPLLFAWRSEYFTNPMHLIKLIESREEWIQFKQLRHDTSDSENIYWRVIAIRSEDNFRCSIPSRGDIICEGRIRSNLPSETEVRYFDGIVLLKEVFWFQIAVEIPVTMNVREALQRLVNDVPNLDFGKWLLTVFRQLIDVLVHVLKNEEELVLMLNNLMEVHYVRMM